jgi:ABC-2 type transport system permease protein
MDEITSRKKFMKIGQNAIANIGAVYRRELYSYFRSPLAYVITGIFWLVCGVLFFSTIYGTIQEAALVDARQAMGEKMPSFDMSYLFLQNFLGGILGSTSLLILPMLSMGLYTEERKQGTWELLVTAPIANWQVAVAKWGGALTLFGLMILPFLALEAYAVQGSVPPVPLAILFTGHLGLLLQAAAILAVGMFVSACSTSSIGAAFITFLLVTAWNNLDLLVDRLPTEIGPFVANFSVVNHFHRLAGGVIDAGSLTILASYTLLGIFLTAQSIEFSRGHRS